MKLKLNITFGPNRRSLPPFDREVAYGREDWWNKQLRLGSCYVQVLEGAAEVARVRLDDPGCINPDYAGVPELGPERLKIQYFEVAGDDMNRGVGTAAVRALEKRYPDRRLFVYSDADGFWGSLGWDRFEGERLVTLFIQPVRE